jgi:hypothetical protein
MFTIKTYNKSQDWAHKTPQKHVPITSGDLKG